MGFEVNSSKWWMLIRTFNPSLSAGFTRASTLRKIFGLESVLRTGTRVVVPTDRDPDVIETLGADVVDVLGRVGDPPVLSGRGFQPVAQVRTAAGTAARPDEREYHGG